jgi:SAM-dependent methyltransferase
VRKQLRIMAVDRRTKSRIVQLRADSIHDDNDVGKVAQGVKIRAVDNYEFCADFAARHGGRVLDYGCGAGQVVALMRKKGIEAYGCDAYEGGSGRYNIIVEATFIRTVSNGRIPFDDEFFDVVVNNQVMEHVVDLNAVIREIGRVLKPGGVVLSLFPDKSIWREGHCGVPFAHWFAKRSGFRFWYVYLFRCLGFGINKEGKTRMQWARHMCDYLDNWTHYRSYGEIAAIYERHFSGLQHIEAEWLAKRVETTKAKAVIDFIPQWAQVMLCRKYGGMVFSCQKR